MHAVQNLQERADLRAAAGLDRDPVWEDDAGGRAAERALLSFSDGLDSYYDDNSSSQAPYGAPERAAAAAGATRRRSGSAAEASDGGSNGNAALDKDGNDELDDMLEEGFSILSANEEVCALRSVTVPVLALVCASEAEQSDMRCDYW
jgi:hypothetical protein